MDEAQKRNSKEKRSGIFTLDILSKQNQYQPTSDSTQRMRVKQNKSLKADPEVDEPICDNKHVPFSAIDKELGLEVGEPPGFGGACTPSVFGHKADTEVGEPPPCSLAPGFVPLPLPASAGGAAVVLKLPLGFPLLYYCT